MLVLCGRETERIDRTFCMLVLCGRETERIDRTFCMLVLCGRETHRMDRMITSLTVYVFFRCSGLQTWLRIQNTSVVLLELTKHNTVSYM